MKSAPFFVVLTLLVLSALPLNANEVVAGKSHEELLLLGEKMYREGILPSGKPMKAQVMGDIPVDGRMFTCDDCHQRSGLGSEEGTIITWPINGKELYSPRRVTGAFRPPETEEERLNVRRTLPRYYQVPDARPAYTDKTLAKALRLGVDPTGRYFDPAMPTYKLGKSNMDIMLYYLKHLSVEIASGVDKTTLHVATVIAGDVLENDRSSMLEVLKAHIHARNSESRHETRRSEAGPFYKSERHKSYRKLQLHIWELTGDEDTWTAQLEQHYAKQPVFALLGGISVGSWAPIHSFTEPRKIPCIFPITDLPTVSDTDWYTLYFGKGYYQEGESVAKYVRAEFGTDESTRILQIYQDNSPGSVALADSFQKTWQDIGGEHLQSISITNNTAPSSENWQQLFGELSPDVVLIWLDQTNKQTITTLAPFVKDTTLVAASANLLNRTYDAFPEPLKQNLVLTLPTSLPHDNSTRRFAVKRWLQARKIPLLNFEIQAKMYFLGWMLPGSLKGMRSEFYREYFLEKYDMMTDQDYSIAVYPRLTFGPGQRYASKGCYLVKLTGDEAQPYESISNWVTY